MNGTVERYRCVVVGLGASGSAALYALSKQGIKVLGLEAQPRVGHAMGSSHGGSRIIRMIYQEHPSYIELLRRSYAGWTNIERASGTKLFVRTGCLNVSAPTGRGGHGHSCYQGAVESAREHGLAHEILNARGLQQRFPAFVLPNEFQALLDPTGGFLYPELAIRTMVNLALGLGAAVRCNCAVQRWEVTPDERSVVLHTAEGDTVVADSVIFTAGAWMGHLVPDLAGLLTVERQVVGWFKVPPKVRPNFDVNAFPVFLLDDDEGYYYGFPADEDNAVKLGKYHHLGEVVDDMAAADRMVNAQDEAAMRRCLQRYLPSLAEAPMVKSSVCFFTNTVDGHFILDRHPAHPAVVLGSACSGHGFKFAPVLGEILSELALFGKTKHDIIMHRIDRDGCLGQNAFTEGRQDNKNSKM